MSDRDKSAPPVRIAMLGAGTVGSSVAQLLARHQHDLAHRVGAGFELIAVGVKDINKPRVGIAQSLLTQDLESVALSGADILIEVMGGIEPARSLILSAMEAGASVVTANKALMAEDGKITTLNAEQGGAFEVSSAEKILEAL